MDVTVGEGERAAFRCAYNGTNEIPWWRISSFAYYFDQLPGRHIYSVRDKILWVSNVQLSDNASTYQCFFHPSGVASTIGRLYVVDPGKESTVKYCGTLLANLATSSQFDTCVYT